MRTLPWTVLIVAVALHTYSPASAQEVRERYPPGFAGMPNFDGALLDGYPDAPHATTSTDRTAHATPIEIEELRSLPPEPLNDNLPQTGNVTFDGVDLNAGYQTVRRRLLRQPANQNPAESPDLLSEEPVHYEPYHWGGLIGQSLLFNLVENTFRIESDDQIRALLAHKPFWHDWMASMRHFNMRRWNDGDDFLVNYVGHPMQGAVSGFIEIQNDPIGRQQEISATREYWISRAKALLWATVYSTHSEISPIGEAGIGNEGGWTYPIDCKRRCTAPGTYNKYTNNTGWVDFIITPTVGNLWLISEDVLDRYVSDRVQGGNRSRIFPKILRGTLNPSRTMANALRFKPPWYRDFQHNAELETSHGIHFLTEDQPTETARLRHFLVMPYFVAMPLGTADHHCRGCLENPGVGVEADILLKSWIGVSFAAGRQGEPLKKTPPESGSMSNWGIGIRLLHHGPRDTASFAVRTGLLHENLMTPSPIDPVHITYSMATIHTNVTHAASSFELSNDFNVNKFLAFRSSFSDTLVRYQVPSDVEPGIGKPPYLSWLSRDRYVNKSTWTTQIGPVVRF